MRKYNEDYAGFVNPPDSANPYGSPKNATTDTAEDGTPVEEKWVGDVWGFLQSIMVDAGETPNGQTESVANPQVLNALKKSIEKGVIREASPSNNQWNGFFDPAHQSQLPSPSGYPVAGGTSYSAGAEWSLDNFTSGGSISSSSTGITFTVGVYKLFKYTAEQLDLIDVNEVPVYIFDNLGRNYFLTNSTNGVNVSKVGGDLKVELTVDIFTELNIAKVWGFFVTEWVGYVPNLSNDALIDNLYDQLMRLRSWKDMKAVRAANVVYTNTESYEINVKIVGGSSSDDVVRLKLNGELIDSSATSIAYNSGGVSATVQPGDNYEFSSTFGTPQVIWWRELRI